MDAHCCDDMRREIGRGCDRHPDRFACPDCLIRYAPRTGEYGLMAHDGGTAVVGVRFCPWCGARLRLAPPERFGDTPPSTSPGELT